MSSQNSGISLPRHKPGESHKIEMIGQTWKPTVVDCTTSYGAHEPEQEARSVLGQ